MLLIKIEYGNTIALDLEEAEKAMIKLFNPNEPFSFFVRNIEDAIDATEAASCPFVQQ